MYFFVYDAQGDPRYSGDNWPQARAVLDYLIQLNQGCPELFICGSSGEPYVINKK